MNPSRTLLIHDFFSIVSVINNSGCCHASLSPSTQKKKKKVYILRYTHYYVLLSLSIEHKLLCTILCIFNDNGIFVTVARNLLYKLQQLVMKS